MTTSIREKLLLIFVTIVLAGGLALFVSAGFQLERAILAFHQRDILARVLQIANLLPEAMEHFVTGQSTNEILQTTLERADREETLHFVLTNVDSRVVASTTDPRAPLFSTLLLTPDVTSALGGNPATHRFALPSGEIMLYATAPIFYEDEIIGVLQGQASMAPAYEEARENWLALARIAVPILALVVVASLWVGQQISRPIRALNRAAQRLTEGHFDERVAVTTRDEIGQLAQSFNQMADQINALITAQRSFVNNAAHELRAPLAEAQMRLEALRSGTLSAEQQTAYLAETHAAIAQMSALISQLLILARLDEGQLVRPVVPIDDPAAFLQDTLRRWRHQTTEAEIQLQQDIPADLPPLAIRAEDLQLVLDNLFGNALKYTPAGGSIRLQVAVEQSELVLCVIDSGIGFTPEDAPHLFERFYRTPASRDARIPGTGLGLSIVQAVIEYYGGTITAQSTGRNQGATFCLRLPLRAA
ncbi:MAG: hypothetical protein Kow0077_25260 [Anaerolineae bacterium]